MIGANIVKSQYSPKGGVNGKMQARPKGSVVEGYLARASRRYDLVGLGESRWNPGGDRTRSSKAI